jgi:putative transposase
MTRYIDAHKEKFGVEPICRVLQFAPATYYAANRRQPSPRQIRDAWLKTEIQRIWTEHRRIYGADKVWAQLKRERIQAARCTVERLMHELGIRGVVRGKVIRAPPGRMRRLRRRRIWSIGASAPRRPTASGWRT